MAVMKKMIISFLAFLLLGVKAAMAATGAAYDGLFFILLVAGFLLLIYLLLTFIDFISLNGRRLCVAMGHKIHSLLLLLFRHRKVNHFDPVC